MYLKFLKTPDLSLDIPLLQPNRMQNFNVHVYAGSIIIKKLLILVFFAYCVEF